MKMSLLSLRACGPVLACAAVFGVLSLCAFAPGAGALQVSYQQVTPVGFYDAVPTDGSGGRASTALFDDANNVSLDGGSVFFSTFGPFPGIPDTGGRLDIFRANRGADGVWSTTWMSPGASTHIDDNQSDRFFEAASTDGTKMVYVSRAQNDPSRVDCGETLTVAKAVTLCYVRVYEYDSSTGRTTLISRATEQPDALFPSHFVGASPDLGTVTWLSQEAMAPGVEDQNSYDVYSSTDGGPATLVSAVSGSTGSVSATQLGPSLEKLNEETGYQQLWQTSQTADSLQVPARNTHLVSADGSEVFFQDVRQLTAGAAGPDIQNVYMRRGATTTLVSSGAQRTLPTTVAPAVSFFEDATPDGRSVFFDTASQLTDGDGNSSFDVYRYDVSTGEVSLVSAVGASETAAVGGTGSYFAAASSDGSHIYFASRDDLDPGSAPPGVAWKLYERVSGRTRFIALFPELKYLEDVKENIKPGAFAETNELTSDCTDNQSVIGIDEGISSTIANGGCEAVATMRATADGSRLIFESAQRLTPDATGGLKCVTSAPNMFDNGAGNGGGALSGGAPGEGCNIYMYDDATGTITLLSPGASTYGAFFTRVPLENTFGGTVELTAPLYQPLLMSSSGDQVFFFSKDALVPGAVSGLRNIYMWSNGMLSLVSPPNETSEAIYDGNSADGSQVFFHSRQSLIPGVEDHQQFAIYDAQLGEPPAVAPADPPPAAQPVASAPGQALTVTAAAVATPAAVSVSAASTTSPLAPAKQTKTLTRAQKLTKALKACKGDRSLRGEQRRADCETQARKAYGPTIKSKVRKKSNRKGGR